MAQLAQHPRLQCSKSISVRPHAPFDNWTQISSRATFAANLCAISLPSSRFRFQTTTASTCITVPGRPNSEPKSNDPAEETAGHFGRGSLGLAALKGVFCFLVIPLLCLAASGLRRLVLFFVLFRSLTRPMVLRCYLSSNLPAPFESSLQGPLDCFADPTLLF